MNAFDFIPRAAVAAALLGLAACGSSDTDPDGSGEIQPGDPSYERDPALDVANVSARGETRSHNSGMNCMHCHQPHGPGKGLFTAAGTVHNVDGSVHPDATLRLSTMKGGAGDVVLELAADGLGNFFTTEPLPFPEESLFPSAVSADGTLTVSMPFPTISGACNVCHTGGFRVTLKEEGP